MKFLRLFLIAPLLFSVLSCSSAKEFKSLTSDGFVYSQKKQATSSQKADGLDALDQWLWTKKDERQPLAERIVAGRVLDRMPIQEAIDRLGAGYDRSKEVNGEIYSWRITKELQSQCELNLNVSKDVVQVAQLYLED